MTALISDGHNTEGHAMISRINPVILTQTRHLTDPPSPPPTIIVKCEIHRQIRCANMKLLHKSPL